MLVYLDYIASVGVTGCLYIYLFMQLSIEVYVCLSVCLCQSIFLFESVYKCLYL